MSNGLIESFHLDFVEIVEAVFWPLVKVFHLR